MQILDWLHWGPLVQSCCFLSASSHPGDRHISDPIMNQSCEFQEKYLSQMIWTFWLLSHPTARGNQYSEREREKHCELWLVKKHNYQLGMKQPNNPKLICHTVIPQKIPKDPLKAMDLCVFLILFYHVQKQNMSNIGNWTNQPAQKSLHILTCPKSIEIHILFPH